MPILRIQFAVRDFEDWKRDFDADPVDRKGSGVRRYHVLRAVADRNFVMVDLEFDTVVEAERTLEKLRHFWSSPDARVARLPNALIIESVESKTL